MFLEYDDYTINLKDSFNKIRKIINFLIATSAVLGMVYLVYSILLLCDDMILAYTAHIFTPLASFLFPNTDGYEMYRNTGFALFGLVIPLFLLYYYSDKKEESLLKAHDKVLEAKKRKTKMIENIEYLKQFENIKQYSICLSIDYRGDKEIKEDYKNKLNYVIFSNFKNQITHLKNKPELFIQDVLIATSSDFADYDNIYEIMLHYLSKTKKTIKEQYHLNLIPSITTDAYTNNNFGIEDIKKHHYEIQSCNFKNKACATNMFIKKYDFINKKKYRGIPAGEFAVFNKNQTNTYELNVVYKNLTVALNSY